MTGPTMAMNEGEGLYIASISLHGLVRARDWELGRDADTGGQIKYVVELARALSSDKRVARVDLLTRKVEDPKVGEIYSRPEEEISPRARIVRRPCGPKRYLRKEVLWPHIDAFIDQVLQHFRQMGRVPDLLHSHYADAGLVGARLAGSLGVPLVHTGHSLGRVKRDKLLARGLSAERIEKQFNLTQRIEAEEVALENASFVVASTHQEVEEQYSLYDNYEPHRMVVIPPGVDLTRFRPPGRKGASSPIQAEIDRFLSQPGKPLIVALSRADTRKNLTALVRAYGESEALRDAANLLIVAGNRDRIRDLDKEPRGVWTELLFAIDEHDLHGQVAYPKHHAPDDVPRIYELAARRRGVFVNPALTEPFGLTLLEAAASGLPVVAPNDGGPQEILERCRNGVLVDPLDVEGMGRAILDVLSDRDGWKRLAASGLAGVKRHYAWSAHVKTYLRSARKLALRARAYHLVHSVRNRLPVADRTLICDVDNTLTGDRGATQKLVEVLEGAGRTMSFGVATGRSLSSALKVLRKWKVPRPDVLITSVGTEIYYGARLQPDSGWARHIEYRWRPDEVRDALESVPGLRPQLKRDISDHKISYFIDPDEAPSVREISAELRRRGLKANVIMSLGMFLDVIPVRASKGRAVRYLSMKWNLPADKMLVAGDSGNDEELLCGDTMAVVVGNYSEEIERLRGNPRIYFSERSHAWGILDGMIHYGFLEESSELRPVEAASRAEVDRGSREEPTEPSPSAGRSSPVMRSTRE